MTGKEAVSLLLDRFPALKDRVRDPAELDQTPHLAYSLLAYEALEKSQDMDTLLSLCRFIDELANSADPQLEELLVVDVLEGIAQNPHLAQQIGPRISSKAAGFLSQVEADYFGRGKSGKENPG